MPKRVEFDAPEGFIIPEGMGPEDDIETLATVRVKPGGRLCLVALDEIRLPGFRKDDDDGKTYADAAAEAMEQPEDY